MNPALPCSAAPAARFRFPARCLSWCVLAVLAASCTTENPPSPATPTSAGRKLPGWGRTVDPAGDCRFLADRDTLLIRVPASSQSHDLASDIDRTNAPCVLRKVEGDFIVQVRVDGRFVPGGNSTQPGRFPYNGAGLVALADPRNVITLARAALQHPGHDPEPYANFEIRVNGGLQRIGLTGDHPLPKDGPVWLRLERHDSQITGMASLDGLHWDTLGVLPVPDHWPKQLRAGVIAISTSAREFDPQFEQFQVFKP